MLDSSPESLRLDPGNLVTAVIATAHLQWYVRTHEGGIDDHAGLLRQIVSDWLPGPLHAAGNRELGNSFAVWMATGLKPLLDTFPAEVTDLLGNISQLTFAQWEAVVSSSMNLVERSEARGATLKQREMLSELVEMYAPAQAAAFREYYVQRDDLPTVQELMDRLARKESLLPQEPGAPKPPPERPPGRG